MKNTNAVNFKKGVTTLSYLKNGQIKTTGVKLYATGGIIVIKAVTSKGELAKGNITIPATSRRDLIRALRRMR